MKASRYITVRGIQYEIVDKENESGKVEGYEIYEGGDLFLQVYNFGFERLDLTLIMLIQIRLDSLEEGQSCGRRGAFADLRRLVGAESARNAGSEK